MLKYSYKFLKKFILWQMLWYKETLDVLSDDNQRPRSLACIFGSRHVDIGKLLIRFKENRAVVLQKIETIFDDPFMADSAETT